MPKGRKTRIKTTVTTKQQKFAVSARKNRSFIPFSLRQGGFTIKRRIPAITLYNGVLLGSTQISPSFEGTTQPFAVGTPVASVFTNYFDVPFAFDLELAMLSQFNDITSICDRYKIASAKISFNYTANMADGNSAGVQGVSVAPTLFYVVDADDAALPTVTALNAKQGLKKRMLNNNQVSVYVKPKVAQNVFQDGPTSAYSVPSKQVWLNSSYPNVDHYCLKGYIKNMYLNASANGVAGLQIDIEMTVKCKDLQ